MLEKIMAYLSEMDPEIGKAAMGEYERQRHNIELIASENFVSVAVLAATATTLTNKYAEGYPGKRYYGGCEYVDIAENICIERAKKVFGAEHANVQPHSGTQANIAVYMALCKPGDTVLGMKLAHGGHLSHGSPANFSGKNYNIISYGVDPVTNCIDYDEVRRIALEQKPKMIIAGASAYPRFIDYKKFSEICKEVGAYLFVDIAHVAGLVAAGLHPDPVPYADVVTTTTHKTMRGPRGGIILCKQELAAKIDSAVFPGTQGGPLEHVIAAKAVALGEALKPDFKAYQQRILDNAAALAEGLKSYGFDLVSGGTDNHLMLLDLRSMGVTGKELETRLDEVRITVNKNAIPDDPAGPRITSGVRIGTPAVTTRGFTPEDMKEIARLIYLTATKPETTGDEVRASVAAMCAAHPLY